MKAHELSKMYEDYGYIVFRICREILGNDQDAQDAMQDTFLKYWRFASNLRDERGALTTLRRTASSCAIDLLRSRKRSGKYQDSWREFKEMTVNESEEKRLTQMNLREVVQQIFRSLNIDEASLQMAYFYYFDDMTLEEVASTTGYSRRAVGMKLNRFREQALKFCKNHNITLTG